MIGMHLSYPEYPALRTFIADIVTFPKNRRFSVVFSWWNLQLTNFLICQLRFDALTAIAIHLHTVFYLPLHPVLNLNSFISIYHCMVLYQSIA